MKVTEMKPLTKPLVLTDAQRANARVTFNQNRYSLYIKDGDGMVFMSSYFTTEDLIADMDLNQIDPEMDFLAIKNFLAPSVQRLNPQD